MTAGSHDISKAMAIAAVMIAMIFFISFSPVRMFFYRLR